MSGVNFTYPIMPETLAQLLAPFYLGICVIIPEFNLAALLLIGNVLYEPRLSLFYPFSLNHINVALLLIHLFVFSRKFRFRKRTLFHMLPFLIFVIYLSINAILYSKYPEYALDKALSLVMMGVLPVVLMAFRIHVTGSAAIRNLLWSMFGISVVMCLMGIVNWLQAPGIYRLAVLGGGPIGLGRIAGTGLIILIYQWYTEIKQNKGQRYLYYGLVSLFVFTLLLTLTKGPLLSAMISILIANRIVHRRWTTKKRILTGAIVLFVTCLVMDTFRQAGNPNIHVWYGSYIIRIEHIIHAFSAFFHHSIFGIGPGNFSDWEPGWLYPHNLVMEILAETGIIGFVLLILVLFPLFHHLFTPKTAEQTTLTALTLFFLLNQMVSSDIIGARFLWFYYYSYMISTDYLGQKADQNPSARKITE